MQVCYGESLGSVCERNLCTPIFNRNLSTFLYLTNFERPAHQKCFKSYVPFSCAEKMTVIPNRRAAGAAVTTCSSSSGCLVVCPRGTVEQRFSCAESAVIRWACAAHARQRRLDTHSLLVDCCDHVLPVVAAALYISLTLLFVIYHRRSVQFGRFILEIVKDSSETLQQNIKRRIKGSSWWKADEIPHLGAHWGIYAYESWEIPRD